MSLSLPAFASPAISEVLRAPFEPYFEDEGFALYNVDCIEFLRSIEGEFFDLTVTSPPYNIGKSYEGVKTLAEYVDWSAEWMGGVHDRTVRDGSFWLNVGYTPLHSRGKAVPLAYLLWDASEFFLIQEVVWNYGAGVAARHSYSPRNEKLLWYVKDPANYAFDLDAVRDPDVKYPRQFKNGRLKVNPLGKNPTDVWQIPKVTSGFQRSSRERTPHPAQFPEALIDRVVKASSGPGDLVFDPFMGSGTTAVVALANDRRAVGCEVSSDYCDLAVERYLNAKAQRASQLFG